MYFPMMNRTFGIVLVSLLVCFQSGCTSSKEIGQKHLSALVETLNDGATTLDSLTDEKKVLAQEENLALLVKKFREYHKQDERLTFSRSTREYLLEENRKAIDDATRKFRSSLRKSLANSGKAHEILEELDEAFQAIFKADSQR